MRATECPSHCGPRGSLPSLARARPPDLGLCAVPWLGYVISAYSTTGRPAWFPKRYIRSSYPPPGVELLAILDQARPPNVLRHGQPGPMILPLSACAITSVLAVSPRGAMARNRLKKKEKRWDAKAIWIGQVPPPRLPPGPVLSDAANWATHPSPGSRLIPGQNDLALGASSGRFPPNHFPGPRLD